jgi:predicted transcriptional regulator
MTEKMIVLEIVRNMSEHATMEEIIEALATRAAIRRGQRAVEAGDVVSQEEAESRLESWISKSAGLISR